MTKPLPNMLRNIILFNTFKFNGVDIKKLKNVYVYCRRRMLALFEGSKNI